MKMTLRMTEAEYDAVQRALKAAAEAKAALQMCIVHMDQRHQGDSSAAMAARKAVKALEG